MEYRAIVLSLGLFVACSTATQPVTNTDKADETGSWPSQGNVDYATPGNGNATNSNVASNCNATTNSNVTTNCNMVSCPNCPTCSTLWSLPSPTSGIAGDAVPYTAGSIYTFYGRVYPGANNPNAQQTMSWSNSGISARFTNSTTLTVQLGAPPYGLRTYLYVSLDGGAPQLMESLQSSVTFTGLNPGQVHTIKITKRNETALGLVLFNGFSLDPNGFFLAPPASPARHIEVIGDSISCGLGSVNYAPYCNFMSETEDSTEAYGPLTAAAVNADIHLISWSGGGLYRNAGGAPAGVDTLPVLWQAWVPALSGNTTAWDFNQWQPQVVVVNLGTNDFGAGDPGNANFVGAYNAFLRQIRSSYGANAYIFLGISPMLAGSSLASLQAYVAAVITNANNNGDNRVFSVDFSTTTLDNTGCLGHPTLYSHQRMAALLTAAIRQQVGW